MVEPLRSPPPGYWALAAQVAQLRRELVGAYPAVPARRYGTIGDANHQSRQSDHNPDQRRYVRALDVPHVEHHGPPLDWLASFLREVGQAGSQRLNPGGYVIWDRRIASARSGWDWETYTGDNPHTANLHVSVSRLPQFYGLSARWNAVLNIARLKAAEHA